ncbi:MAG TPA: polyphenol oxidase family protein [Candidatus Eisenbacteria bacterium]
MWTLDAGAGLPLWRPTDAPDAILAFTTRHGGVSPPPFDSLNLGRSTGDRPEAVTENRRRLLDALGLDADHLATAGQVHGAAVGVAVAAGHHDGCDVLLTRTPGLALAVTSADCLPLLLVAPGAVAAAHAGWRGTAAGAPRAAVRALLAATGASPGQVQVHLGPCIRPCCYEVGPEVASRFPEASVSRVGDSWRLDLAAAARLQLLEEGLPASAVSDTGACTACPQAPYFSHRRDRGRTGRLWGVAALRA